MNGSLADQILDYCRNQDNFLIDLLQRLVEAESPSSHPALHTPTRHVLMAALSELGFVVREVGASDGPRHVYARPGEKTDGVRNQLLLGHYDTVWPIGTISERPFEVDDNVVRGPGVFDMKGGLAQIVLALKAVGHLGIELPLLPVIFVNADEEIGSRTSTRYVRMLARCAERAFVLEPSMGDEGSIKTERKGIGRFTITVYGKAAHAGLDPESGASAILELSHVIQKLFAMNDAEKGVTINVGTVDGGIQPNVVAPHSSAVVDVRVPTLADGERIEKLIHSMQPQVPGVRLRIEGAIGRPSMEATPRNQALWQQAQQIGEQLGLQLSQARAGGGSDGNTTSQFTATLDGLGPVGHGAHAKHEFLYIDKTLERAALLAMLLRAPPLAQESHGKTA
ncbi:MAG: M20 family metallopeptidase [Gammaproteobacteria bacterium]|nr:M20 family metallopeptidase [Gammaproteobacteria bacterium]MDH3372706.1 M20 family metallopeptidase [Gammaproteobacteria bacterium]MDH3409737.1 M20 family metallopeptidase [Gammaproteobacteria bacterium]MDH3551717.1 M20 family metallopeptidase [Gammaproteobacteria bacterium]